MATRITMENINTREIKETVVGFSWTTLFFGIFVPLLRGDIKWFFVILILAFFTFGLSWFVIPFIYNKLYVKELVSKGYIPYGDMSKYELEKIGIIFRDEEK